MITLLSLIFLLYSTCNCGGGGGGGEEEEEEKREEEEEEEEETLKVEQKYA